MLNFFKPGKNTFFESASPDSRTDLTGMALQGLNN